MGRLETTPLVATYHINILPLASVAAQAGVWCVPHEISLAQRRPTVEISIATNLALFQYCNLGFQLLGCTFDFVVLTDELPPPVQTLTFRSLRWHKRRNVECHTELQARGVRRQLCSALTAASNSLLGSVFCG